MNIPSHEPLSVWFSAQLQVNIVNFLNGREFIYDVNLISITLVYGFSFNVYIILFFFYLCVCDIEQQISICNGVGLLLLGNWGCSRWRWLWAPSW